MVLAQHCWVVVGQTREEEIGALEVQTGEGNPTVQVSGTPCLDRSKSRCSLQSLQTVGKKFDTNMCTLM